MATKKQDTTATTEQEKPRAIMDLISIYDIIGGSYNLGDKLWDYLTQEEQKELSDILQKENNGILNKFILDYYNLREDVRVCNGL